jgi:FtsP/CotA-like multicopper oxidase with cupredoxin domain
LARAAPALDTDGFPWPQTSPIANGVVQGYDYAPIAGTYWMHSHHEMQEQSLMTAPPSLHMIFREHPAGEVQ